MNPNQPIITKRFIAVTHTWFVSSEGFYVEELEATNRKQADIEAALLYRFYNGNLTHAEVKVIELQTGEHLPRKLTLWERLVGRISETKESE